jgi:NADH-quinone oxidoreductase subunit F
MVDFSPKVLVFTTDTVSDPGVESISKLRAGGFDAVFVSVGAATPKRIGIEGEDHEGVVSGLHMLEAVNRGDMVDVRGRIVVVLGGGNAAMDSARMAVRLGAKEVHIAYGRTVADMPASRNEVRDSLAERIGIHEMRSPVRFAIRDGSLAGVK